MSENTKPRNPLEIFCEGVCEVRVLKSDAYKTTYSGYFDDLNTAFAEAGRYDGLGNVYFVMNPVTPDVMSRRSAGKIVKAGQGETTKDADIAARRWLLFDFDPERASGISATDGEKAAALAVMENASRVLALHGFCPPVVCDSGNGYHLLYRIDLPNDAEAAKLVKGVLGAASLLFSTEAVKVDRQVFNAARITKFYGSMAVKGKSTAERPHRRSAILAVPEQIETTPAGALEDFVKTYMPEPPKREYAQRAGGREFDLDRWLDEHGVRIRERVQTSDGTRYVLEDGCPFNPEHKGKDAVIFKHQSGGIGFKCFHNSCADRRWRDFRQLYEPDAYDKGYRPTAREQVFADPVPERDTEATAKAVETAIAENPDTLDKLLPDDLLEALFAMEDEVARQRELAKLKAVAREKKFAREFDALVKARADKARKDRQPQEPGDGSVEYLMLPQIPLEGLVKPEGWHIGTGRGVWRYGDKGLEKACAHPIIITDRLQNIDTRNEKLQLAFYRDHRWTQLPVKCSTVASRVSIVSLADAGVQVNSENAKHLVQFLHDLETENAEIIPRRRSISRAGWIGTGEFFPYADCVFDGEDEARDMYEGLREAGDYRAWLDAIGGARTESMAFRALLAASFSAPLLWMLGALCYCLHIWGGSGTGKTVALYAAMSVWGDPLRLYRSFNATENGLEKAAQFCHSIPLAIDERETAKEERHTSFDRIIYRLTEGRGRTKLDRNSNMKLTGEWRVPILTTGEAPLLGESSKGGAMGRAIELYCPQAIFPDAPALADLVKANHGHAGRVWVERLVAQRASKEGMRELRDTFETFQGVLRDRGEYNDKPVASAAAMLTADFYASCWVFRMDEYTAMARAMELSEYITGNLPTKTEADTMASAWDYLCGWVAANIKHFQDFSDPRYGVLEAGSVFLIGSYFNEALTADHRNPIACAKEFARRGYIQTPGDGKRLQFPQRLNGLYTRGYRLNLDTTELLPPVATNER